MNKAGSLLKGPTAVNDLIQRQLERCGNGLPGAEGTGYGFDCEGHRDPQRETHLGDALAAAMSASQTFSHTARPAPRSTRRA